MSQRSCNPCIAVRELLDVLVSKVIIFKKVHFIQLRGGLTFNKKNTSLSCVYNNNTGNKRGLRKQENAPLSPTISRSGNDFLCLMFFVEGTRLKQEEPLMSYMKTSLMPRTPVTTCQASMSAIVTSWSSTTMQTEYV